MARATAGRACVHDYEIKGTLDRLQSITFLDTGKLSYTLPGDFNPAVNYARIRIEPKHTTDLLAQ